MRALAKLAVPVLLATAACAARAPRPRALPLEAEGLLLVYLEPLPAAAGRLSFEVEGAAAIAADGAEVPLVGAPVKVEGRSPNQRLLASARLAPGGYEGLALRVRHGVVAGEGGSMTDLLAPEAPLRASGRFTVNAGEASVVWLGVGAPAEGEVRLAPALRLAPAPRPIPSWAVAVAGPALVTLLDRRDLQVGGADVLPRGAEGVAVDPARGLAYVSEPDADTVAVLDLGTGERLREIRLDPGDRPGALALSPDGVTVLSVNRGTETVSFLDTATSQQMGRSPVGQDPSTPLVDRQGRFAYLACRASNAVVVLDLASRSVAGTIATDPAPVDVALSRSGELLHVAHAGSAYLASFRLPGLTAAARLFVGLGASAVQVDARTDVLMLALADERAVRFYAPGSPTFLASVDLPGAATRLLVQDVEGALVALVPSARQVVSIDLTTRRVRAVAELSEVPSALALAGERR